MCASKHGKGPPYDPPGDGECRGHASRSLKYSRPGPAKSKSKECRFLQTFFECCLCFLTKAYNTALTIVCRWIWKGLSSREGEIARRNDRYQTIIFMT